MLLQETVSDLLHQKRPEPSFDVDFSKWDPEGWWHRFRGLFMADQTTSHSVLNVDVEEAPDGITALKLSVRRNGHLTGRTLYRLNAKQPTKIIDANTNKVSQPPPPLRVHLFATLDLPHSVSWRCRLTAPGFEDSGTQWGGRYHVS